jgi:hypothetical protein
MGSAGAKNSRLKSTAERGSLMGTKKKGQPPKKKLAVKKESIRNRGALDDRDADAAAGGRAAQRLSGDVICSIDCVTLPTR